jgi:hypothetical protein
MTSDMERFEMEETRDAMLFRFWVRCAADWPGETARALTHCHSAEDYRAALTSLAHRVGVNLP